MVWRFHRGRVWCGTLLLGFVLAADAQGLPSGSAGYSQSPSAWEHYRWRIGVVLVIMLLQAATIAWLLLERGRRRRAEKDAREIGGRLITAQEEERRRIARDLHDDLNQRLALLSVEVDLAEQAPASTPPPLAEMAAQIKDLSSEVHRLSYQLHPAKLDQLGLVAAAQTLCRELSAQSALRVNFTHDSVPRKLPTEVALCVFRILQEALGNAIRHSGADEIAAKLWVSDGHLRLLVADAGRGFDPEAERRDGGMGLLSMAERARLVRGRLAVHAAPGRGTRVELVAPLAAAGAGRAV